MTTYILRGRRRPRRGTQGFSLVELMIAMAIGLIVLGAMVAVFANTSASRQEMERSARQIENGRYAMQVLSDDIRMSGFYGELDVKHFTSTYLGANADSPCWNGDITVLKASMSNPLMVYDQGVGVPPCGAASRVANTDVIVVRRASGCVAGIGTCPTAVPPQPYLQVAMCATEVADTLSDNQFRLGLMGTATFDRHERDCATVAGLRQYFIRFYYISDNNGRGVSIPTLKRLDFNGTSYDDVPLVEGIENVNYEFGIDTDGDGAPDVFMADPTGYKGTTNESYANIVAVRITLIARSIDPTPNYVDKKTYTLGLDAAGGPVLYTPNDAYRRHVYTSLVRITNVAERRDVP
jgi:type IV pilus assembly protein PilW